MGFPKIVVHDRQVILLSGYHEPRPPKDNGQDPHAAIAIDAEDKLKRAVKRHPGAVAFGYVSGEWVAGA